MNNSKVNINEISDAKQIIALNDKFKVVYFHFEEGKGLPNHSHAGYASILVYDGSVTIDFTNGDKYELNKGEFLPFDARIEHNVIAKTDSKVLVTISEKLN